MTSKVLVFRPTFSLEELKDINTVITNLIACNNLNSIIELDDITKARYIKLNKKISIIIFKADTGYSSPVYETTKTKQTSLSYEEKLGLVNDFDVDSFTKEMESLTKDVAAQTKEI